jgi:hypothetical protein
MATEALVSAPVKSGGFFFGGKAVFTVCPSPEFVRDHEDCKDHYTFKLLHKEASAQWPECWMVFLMTGPDNYADFSYMGKLDTRSGAVLLTKKSCVGPNAWPKLILERVIACALANQLDKIEANGWGVLHEGRCCVCGRRLTVPESIESGIGPECAGRIGGAR